MMETTTRRRASGSNLPINYAVAQEETDLLAGGTNSNLVSRSPSQSLLAQLSSSPYGWTGSSRSTSPTPPTMLSGSLRRVPSGTNTTVGGTGRFIPQQSLQSLVKSFINKVSRGTQTDWDNNNDNDFDDQISIASLTSGFSAFENENFTRSRLKLFLNDSQYQNNINDDKNNIDETEFVEELQKLRDQIDGRFKFSFSSSQPGSRSVSRQTSRPTSRPRSPTTTTTTTNAAKVFDLEVDQNLEEFGQKLATCDQAIETDSCCLMDKSTQADFGPQQQQQQQTSNSSFFSFFSSGQPTTTTATTTMTTPTESFNVAIQTDLNPEHLCPLCKHELSDNDCQSNGNLLTKSQLLDTAISTSDMNNNSMMIVDDKKSIDHSTQADMKGDSTLLSNNDDGDENQEQKQGSNFDDDKDKDKNKQIEPPIAAKRKTANNTTKGVSVGSGHFYRGEKKSAQNHYVNSNGTTNGVMMKNNSSGRMRIITSNDDDKDKTKMKSTDHVRPKCCSIS
ncbi:uncharacterized protein LOC124498616 isoform X2 [Dermatophagoides farinae]|uniref:Uncharacterized protein n=1 Tax=Dermatophagoides farinae TaxID=6954 RepID=A0A922LAR4_DERFA|nr:homeobox protein 10-like isoform X2 [Dermatophagoides farinae]KAH7636551.1 hypothetical protein HUG17_10521 [Dermatophagoides farinae]KAH9528638.1 hypothetical protein DERF_002560 [Dermatophagoides farinae]